MDDRWLPRATFRHLTGLWRPGVPMHGYRRLAPRDPLGQYASADSTALAHVHQTTVDQPIFSESKLFRCLLEYPITQRVPPLRMISHGIPRRWSAEGRVFVLCL